MSITPARGKGSSDRPAIAYQDTTNGGLKYAYFDGLEWQIESVDNSPIEIGGAISLAVEKETGKPHMSYCNIYLPITWMK